MVGMNQKLKSDLIGLVIFDCDGVLVDSEPIANKVLTEELALCGLHFSAAEVALATTGLSMKQVLGWAEEIMGNSLPKDFVKFTQEKTFEKFRSELLPIPGVKIAVDSIVSAGVPVCVASSGEYEKMRLTLGLTDLHKYFGDCLYSASDVAWGKPAPDIFVYAAKRMGIDPKSCVVVEDSVPGVMAGVAAGMTVYGYSGGMEDRRLSLSKVGAILIDDMSSLPSHLGLH